MTLEVWQKYVLRHLEAVLAALGPLAEDPVSGRTGEIPGVLEWTLPWSMDDGMGNVRLTLFEERRGRGAAPRVRVVVAAVAKPFAFGQPTVVDLPRHDPDSAGTDGTGPQAGSPTREMARYLMEHTGGDAESLKREPDGAVSFTVVVAGGQGDREPR
ncbi:hypothetical protein [Streptomyces sp. DH37]|uniref:hypothetical protein n=1 Tax=Streptomyces sp. DH37 TaxID=3040122 RepID=UPI0024434CAF|nr:hypothetical protein [Streptomyces sp. DH37]MDG9701324.1 hypothetical protein [Streptomyces sp. DH37]